MSSPGLLLKTQGLEKRFGGIVALSGYDVEIESGELLGLIGPNGAGKTTVFNLLSGVIKSSKGRIVLEGRDITNMRPDQNAARGISRTFQNIRLFNELTVLENIKVALHMRMGRGFWQTLLHTPGFRSAEAEMDKSAAEFAELLDLKAAEDEPAGNLPYGVQRRVEIARAMATAPKLLLLDEPAAGLNPSETDELAGAIENIHRRYGVTVFLVEHDMKFVMAVCRRIQVIDQGRVLTVGTPEEIRGDRRVVEAYLGKSNGGRRAGSQ